MVTTSVGTPSRLALTGERMAERGWLLKRSYPVPKNRTPGLQAEAAQDLARRLVRQGWIE